MKIVITKGRGSDAIAITRADGTRADTTLSQKGPVPHDAVHWFVERAFALDRGFWGMVAAGNHPEAVAGIAKDAGHASASRNRVPDASIVELLQVLDLYLIGTVLIYIAAALTVYSMLIYVRLALPYLQGEKS